MRIRMVGHASVILYTQAGGILCDPWLKGKAFNNSWSLRPEPSFDASLYEGIDYIWISHEHPDHFSVATLRDFDEAFKARVTVLFQKKNSTKLFDAMRKWGYKNFRALPDRADVDLGKGVRISCHQIGFIDSLLGVSDGAHTVINLNDTDVTAADLARLRKQFGPVDVVLNQFSIAGFDGYKNAAEALRRSAAGKLQSMIEAHRLLDARHTIPFASFVYFSAIDNRFINQYANTIDTTLRAFEHEKLDTIVLAPGDCHTPGEAWKNAPAISVYRKAEATIGEAEYDTPEVIALEELEAAFQRYLRDLRRYFPQVLLSRIGTLRWRVADHDAIVATDFAKGTFEILQKDGDADIDVYSQPLHHGFATPFGFETLAVSGRFHVQNNRSRWRWLKAVSILFNQGVYLKPRYVLSGTTLGYLFERLRHNLLGQIFLKRQQRKAMG
ncbi:MAG: MBL fold metallo-hydrolase [Beijerinckiaceae bacterium]